MKNHGILGLTPLPPPLRVHLSQRCYCPLLPPTRLSHRMHTSMDTRGRGSSSDVHCDVAKVRGACK